MPQLDRETLIRHLQQAVEAQPWVQAAWLGGSEAFGRVDEWSDVDLVVISDDERVAETFAAIEAALQALSPIIWHYEMPMPTWHGHAQRFYRLRDTSEYLLIDAVVLQRSHPERFLEPERHGRPRVLTDRGGLIVQEPGDQTAWRQRLQQRVEAIRAIQPLFRNLLDKAIRRGDVLEALQTYQQRVLLPLVELLRIRHDPWRHDFGVRYLRCDLPEPVVRRLESLFFVGRADQLSDKQAEAIAWMDELLADLAPETATDDPDRR